MVAGTRNRTSRRTRGRLGACFTLSALAGSTGWLVGSVGALCAFAFTAAVLTVAGVVFLGWCEHRQSLYRRRLLAGPMHVHGRKPCYGRECAPVREEVTA